MDLVKQTKILCGEAFALRMTRASSRNVGKFYRTVKLSAKNLCFMQIATENDVTSVDLVWIHVQLCPSRHWLFLILRAYLEFFFLEAAHLSKASFSEDDQEVKVLQLHLGQVMCPGGQLRAAADVNDGIGTGALSLINDRSLAKLIYQLWRERGEREREKRERERARERGGREGET